jgi:thiamine biosynthesis protein ThiS
MIVTANGKQRTVSDGASINDLLSELALSADRVVVEHNGKPLRREVFSQTKLQSDDRLEIAQMVGGG